MSIKMQPTAGDGSAFPAVCCKQIIQPYQPHPWPPFAPGNPVCNPPPWQNLLNVYLPRTAVAFSPCLVLPFCQRWQIAAPAGRSWVPFCPNPRPRNLLQVSNAPPAASVAATATRASIRIRSVWAHNLEAEFNLIREALVRHRCATIDTEFPGVVFRCPKHPSSQTPEERYALLRSNVSALKLLQLGLTLSDERGRLPDLRQGSGAGFVWEFNFRGFDPSRDPHAPESVEMLRNQGLDLSALNTRGVDPVRFAELMMISGLVMNSSVTWLGFHNCYDLGFLLKTLMNRELPPTLQGFHEHIRFYLSHRFFDMKFMMKFCKGLFGGLEKVAATLKVDRPVGMQHHAGSDSLLTLKVFLQMHSSYFAQGVGIQPYVGVLYGLDVL